MLGAGIILLAALAADLRIPVEVHAPESARGGHFPVTFGVPFAKGVAPESTNFVVVDESGAEVASQVSRTASWEDRSWRWGLVDFVAAAAHRYSLISGTARAAADDLRITQNKGELTVATPRASYVFREGGGCFDAVNIEGRALVGGGKNAFYIVDSRGARSTLRGSPKLIVEGRRHAVVRVEGEYRTAENEPIAGGAVDFHFYAGTDAVRISHQLLVTRDTNELWFRDIGFDVPLALGDSATASLNDRHDDPRAIFSRKLAGNQALVMVQDELPHFGSTASRSRIFDPANAKSPLQTGTAAGDWADITSSAGVSVQLPGFAEQFPTAFRVSPKHLAVAFWANESGRELDYRTASIIPQYFGNDWIPADHKCAQLPNTAQGTAKTHELRFYPHAGAPATPDHLAELAVGRDEAYAHVDPAWLARSGALGPIHEKDPARFPEAEALISDYFDRTVLAPDRVFPATGYLYWGMYPYGAQPWELKNNRWYPKIHRLARGLDYDLKRSVWILYARSGERKYRDYARRYTRLIRDLQFSHLDAPMKPEGWIVEGQFHCPIIWGQFGEKAFAKAKQGVRPKMTSELSALSFASSEDLIQFVYDYFLTGDLHSRDMVHTYIEALASETGWDVAKTIEAGGVRPEAILRMIGSAYDLDHDPRLATFGGKILRTLVRPDGSTDPQQTAQWGKWGEVFSAYYYYWISTGDPLARKVLARVADFQYRRAALDAFMERSSPLFQAFFVAGEEKKDPTYAAYVARGLDQLVARARGHAKPSVALASLSQSTSEPWGQQIMTQQSAINIGIPVAEAALVAAPRELPRLPVAEKSQATARTRLMLDKDRAGVARLEVFVNNVGEREHRPRLLDRSGRELSMKVAEKELHRVDRADQLLGPGISPWAARAEDQIFYRLELPDSARGVLELDLGDEVAFTVLRSELTGVEQVAPGGLVIEENEKYFFSVPEGVSAVEYFAMLPVAIFDAQDRPVASEELGEGKYRFRAAGAGIYSLVRKDRIPSFVRMQNIPFVVAQGDRSRLFPVPASMPQEKAATPPPEGDFGEGRIGRGAYLLNRFAELPLKPEQLSAFPKERGTVELWVRPLWSATELDFPRAMVRWQFYSADPITLAYVVDPDPDKSGLYNRAHFLMQIAGLGSVRATAYVEAGKWYHVAATWDLDGKDNQAAIFINGRKRTDASAPLKLKPKGKLEKLVYPPKLARFGSAHGKSAMRTGELYDELRVSKTIRYTKDFTPPDRAFREDADTVLLLHLDGDFNALVPGGKATANVKKGYQLH